MRSDFTLLYVEDDDIVRENFKEIFGKYFKNVITADNGKDALKLYKEHNIDLAILDISIPEINGLNVATKIRETDRNTKIIMISAYSDKSKLLQAINLHLFSYLIKPVQRKELDETLNRVIKKLSSKFAMDLKNGYKFDVDSSLLTFNDKHVKISKNEQKLLSFLCSKNDSHHSACDIYYELFGAQNEDDSNANNIVQLISRFKKKMLNLHDNEYFFIDNVYGLGYKISN
ncbi:response regulator transcription factor [Sulfurimonas sp.]